MNIKKLLPCEKFLVEKNMLEFYIFNKCKSVKNENESFFWIHNERERVKQTVQKQINKIEMSFHHQTTATNDNSSLDKISNWKE